MAHMKWSEEFATGINVIDGQHKRIIHYINQLTDAQELNEPELVSEVLVNLIDYTLSHFAFEESLMDESGYEASTIHKQTHNAFKEKINSYQERHNAGEDVSAELFQLLNIWLMEHIMDDDSDYSPIVKKNMPCANSNDKASCLKKKIQKFFS